MRLPVPLLVAGLLAACGAEPAPPPAGNAPPEPAGDATAVAPEPSKGGVVRDVAEHLLLGTATDADRDAAARDVAGTVEALLDAAVSGDATRQGRAPTVLAELGELALPALTRELAATDTRRRRIVALTFLQLGDSLHARGDVAPIADALRAARGDPDPAVAAAAEHALRAVTGDTSALEASRAAHEAAERGR